MGISAGIVGGHPATGSVGIKDDLINAGAMWRDEPAFRSGNIVWGRVVADIPNYCRFLLVKHLKNKNQNGKYLMITEKDFSHLNRFPGETGNIFDVVLHKFQFIPENPDYPFLAGLLFVMAAMAFRFEWPFLIFMGLLHAGLASGGFAAAF